MKFLLFFILSLFFTGRICVGQHRSATTSLSSGLFCDTIGIGKDKKVVKGAHLITTAADYKTVQMHGSFFIAMFKNRQQIVIPDRIIHDSFSVRNGWVEEFDLAGRLEKRTFYDSGFAVASHEYENGNIAYYDTIKYDDATEVQLRYYANVLFKQTISQYKKKQQQVVYYPESNLKMSTAEFDFNVDFVHKKSDSRMIVFTADRKLTIDSVVSSSGNMKFLNANNKKCHFPIRIFSKTKEVLKLVYQPTPTSFCERDTLMVYVTDSARNVYYVFTENSGYHLNYQTIDTTTEIHLSKRLDQYLVLAPMGTVTAARLSCPDGSVMHYSIDTLTKIDLSGFEPGVYFLQIISCNHGGNVKVVLGK